jgi:cytolysin (calcineurin-like family phosphatase)
MASQRQATQGRDKDRTFFTARSQMFSDDDMAALKSRQKTAYVLIRFGWKDGTTPRSQAFDGADRFYDNAVFLL